MTYVDVCCKSECLEGFLSFTSNLHASTILQIYFILVFNLQSISGPDFYIINFYILRGKKAKLCSDLYDLFIGAFTALYHSIQSLEEPTGTGILYLTSTPAAYELPLGESCALWLASFHS